MNILVDLDDVVIDFVPNFLKYVERKYGWLVNLNNIDREKVWKYTKNPEQRKKVIKIMINFCKTKEFQEAKPVEGALEGLKKLKEKHRLFIGTNRPLNVKEETLKWIEKNCPDVFEDVIFGNKFQLKDEYKVVSKSDMIKELQCKAIIEDIYDNIKEMPDNITKVLLEKPWNRKIEANGFIKAKNWNEIVRRLP